MKLNWWQRHLLNNASDTFMVGCAWASLPVWLLGVALAILGLLGNLTFLVGLGVALVTAGFGLGALSGVVNLYYRYQCITTASERGEDGSDTRVLYVKDGRVVASGTAVWARGDDVICITLPWLDRDREFDVLVPISQVVDGVRVSFSIALTVTTTADESTRHETFRGFDPQELYDKVVAGGYHSVVAWIADTCRQAFEGSADVRGAVALSVHGFQNPHTLARRVQEALRQVPLSGHPLSNIRGIRATVQTDATTFLADVQYDGAN